MSKQSRKPKSEGSQTAPTNVVWLDLETTGRNCELDGIVEIGAMFEQNGKIVDQFQCYIKPFSTDRIQEAAMRVHKLTLPFLQQNGLDPEDAAEQFVGWLSKYIDINSSAYTYQHRAWIKGWRVHFDLMFLQLFFEKLERKDFFMYFRSLAWDIAPRVLACYEDHLDMIPQHFHLKDALDFTQAPLDMSTITAHSAIDDVIQVRALEQRVKVLEGAKYAAHAFSLKA